MLLDQLAERDAHRFFDNAWFVHMARNLEELGALVIFTPEGAEPFSPAAQDGRRNRDRFNIVYRRRAAIKACTCRERRLQTRLALFALQAFDHRGFFAADIGTCAAMDEDVKIIAGLGSVLADQAGGIGLCHCGFEDFCLINIFTANIDIGCTRTHCEARDQRAFDQFVRIMADDFTIFARTRFGFVGIDNEEAGPFRRRVLGHEAPLHTRREARTTTPAQTRCLDDIDDRVRPGLEQVLRLVPIATLLRRFQPPILETVQIGENAVFVLKAHFHAFL